MTVSELKNKMEELEKQGYGDDPVRVWGPYTDEWELMVTITHRRGVSVDLDC